MYREFLSFQFYILYNVHVFMCENNQVNGGFVSNK